MLQTATQPPLDLREHFSRFRAAHEAQGYDLHFAAHSHHFWPDVSRDAHIAAWDGAANVSGGKWKSVMGEVWPQVCALIAGHLRLPDPTTLVPAPNTHEFVVRLLSCMPKGRPARILTTDGEFHSFARQTTRLAEEGLVELTIVESEPFGAFHDRLVSAAKAPQGFDMVFVSQVFFNSGFAQTDLEALVDGLIEANANPDALIVIDGYHGFLARPTDLSAVADRVFYLAGGYKYAMSGEGACFLHCPPGVAMRPRNTGWYAGFADLSNAPAGETPYGEDGWRFMGATFDPSGLYRMRAVLSWLDGLGVTADMIHAHAIALQKQFIAGLEGKRIGPFAESDLVVPAANPAIGNFLTFRNARAADWCETLHRNGILTDSRADRLRIGFGLYQTVDDVDRLLARLRGLE